MANTHTEMQTCKYNIVVICYLLIVLGKILEATVLMDKMTARSRGFGFVVFEDEDVADKVCALRNHTIDGKITEVRKAEPRSVLLNRKEKDTVNHFAFQNHADVARQQQTPQTTALDGECFCFI